MNPSEEIGRELKASELKVHTVVFIKPPHHEQYMTMWVAEIDAHSVTFYSGVLQWNVINFVHDDLIYDDRHQQVQVFEYLGEV